MPQKGLRSLAGIELNPKIRRHHGSQSPVIAIPDQSAQAIQKAGQSGILV